ncbi:cystathionine beta-lyase [uncultured Mailhella sp.]|uniref:cystathionine beta-lyase n=1 Tax=uncultured Mailhella sp. TaxID=1981031 RepID=UPI002633B06A|nr:cystathionine beta-lyase [uncultured Mailhella sp.]
MKDDTILTHAGRAPLSVGSPVNVPVHRASTIRSPSLEAYEANERGDAMYTNVCYGALGTENAFALCEAVNQLEQGAGTVTASSGLAACTLSLLAFAGAGDHVLMPDSVYGPQRMFCETVLPRFGVETSFYDPLASGADLETLIRANTRVVYTEAPGSLTFEMQDIPAIAEAAHRHAALVFMDNTWAGPLCFKPLKVGVDLCIEAATKYIAGHSDLVLGLMTARTPELYRRLRAFCVQMGEIASPDDCYMALRGLRTLRVRMERQFAHALKIARWLSCRPEVRQVLYPPLEGAPGHDLWARDFQGGGSLFSIVLPKMEKKAVAAMLNGYQLFDIGASWGGYESLVELCHPVRTKAGRREPVWTEDNCTLVRYAIGLEDPDDLIADLAAGFERLRAAL